MNLSKLILLVLLISAGPLARAAAGQAELEKQAERESQWTKVSIALPKATGSAVALRTENGSLRLLEMGAAYSVAAKVYGADGNFRWVYTEKQLEKACKNLASVVDLEIEEGNRFTLEFLANPMNQAAIGGLNLENKVHDVQVEASLSYKDGGEPLLTQARLLSLQAELNQKIKDQAATINRTGIAKIEWNGIDDLVCDLLSGQVKLQTRLLTRFESAELRRKEVISAAQVQNIQQSLNVLPVAEQSAGIRLLSRTANLGVLLQQELGGNYVGFMQNKFHKFHGQLIQLPDGGVVPLTADGAFKAARKLDDLSVGQDINSSVVSTNVEWDF